MDAARARVELTKLGHRAYIAADEWCTRLLREYRYDAPTEMARNLTPSDLGLANESVWRTSETNWLWYEASPWGILRRVLATDEVNREDVFLDLGSGTGRVLLEAALHYPFRRIIGVEVVPKLTAIARETIDRNRHRM